MLKEATSWATGRDGCHCLQTQNYNQDDQKSDYTVKKNYLFTTTMYNRGLRYTRNYY